ncbi:MAG: lipocalin [Gammaproteobacteria bacterium]|nr:lipocalin [Gammaproteobacteria bacterium]
MTLNARRAILLPTLALIAVSGVAKEPLDVVDRIDFERYQGLWYEIARLPNRFQAQCSSDVTAHYARREDGRIRVTNRCLRESGQVSQAEGIARKVEPEGPDGALEVRFAPKWLSLLPFVWGDYRVFALDEDYRHVLVGSENRRYLWLLAREPSIPERVREELLHEASRSGFDLDGLIMTEHGR